MATKLALSGRALELLATHFSLFVLAVLTFGVRVYVHTRLVRKSFAIWIAGAGLAIYITYSGLTVLAAFYGLGQHITHVPPANLAYIFKV